MFSWSSPLLPYLHLFYTMVYQSTVALRTVFFPPHPPYVYEYSIFVCEAISLGPFAIYFITFYVEWQENDLELKSIRRLLYFGPIT